MIFPRHAQWVYSFCRHCWEYRQFTFLEPWAETKQTKLTGRCSVCDLHEQFVISELRHYYEQVSQTNY